MHLYIVIVYTFISFDPLLTFNISCLPTFYFNLKIFVKYPDIIRDLLRKSKKCVYIS